MDQAGVALYHRVMRWENFEKGGKGSCVLVYAAEKKSRESREPCTLTLTDTAMRRAGLTRICGSSKGIRIEISASVSYGSSFPTDF